MTKRKSKTLAPYKTSEKVNSCEFELTYFEPTHSFDASKVKQVKIIAFDDENNILAVRKNKKFEKSGIFNIITGTLDDEDADYIAAAIREAKEEANVALDQLFLAAVIRRAPKGAPFESATCIPVLAACVTSIIPYREDQEPNERRFLTREELLKNIDAPRKEALAKLLDMAEFVLSDAPAFDPIIRQMINNF